MLYMICPTCGEHLGNKELSFIADMKQVCDEIGIDDDIISQSTQDKNPDFIEKRKNIVNKYVSNPCCKMRLLNYRDLVQLIKGR